MGKERGGRVAGSQMPAGAVSKVKMTDDPPLDPHKIVKLWRKGKRKTALDEISKVIEKDPTPVAWTARTWMLYLEWDDMRSRSGGTTLGKLEELTQQVRKSAACGVACRPSSITCAEISLTTQMQLLEALTRDESHADGFRVDTLKHDIAEEADGYLIKEISSWCDPAQEHYAGMQSIEPRAKDAAKARLLAKLEKFREYKQRARPLRAVGTYSAPLETSVMATTFADKEARIEQNFERLRAEIKMERQLAAMRNSEGAGGARNPRVMQQFLQQHGSAQAEQQAETGQQEQRRRGRGGRGRSGTVEEARLEMSRHKKENKDRAAREERIRRKEEVRLFLQGALPEDKDERSQRFLDILSIDIAGLKNKATKIRDKDTLQRINAHLSQLKKYSRWHFYCDVVSNGVSAAQCFKDAAEQLEYLRREHLPGNHGDLFMGEQMIVRLPIDEPQAVKDVPAPDPADNFIGDYLPLPDHPLDNDDDAEAGEAGHFPSSSIIEGGAPDSELNMTDGHHGIDVSLGPDVLMHGHEASAFEKLLRSKMEDYTDELLDRYTAHFVEHLNTQDASEDFHDLLPEESVYLRRWNDLEVAHFQGTAFWSPRNLPQNQLDTYASIGEQMVALARALKRREEVRAEQEQGELSPDKAVELQGRLQSIEQDISIISMRLRGVPEASEDPPVGGSDGATGEGQQRFSPIVWEDLSNNGDDIQLRPEYMQPMTGKAEHEIEDLSEENRLVDKSLLRKQHVLSDIWGGLQVIEENHLLTDQILETIACFSANAMGMRASDVLLNGRRDEMLSKLGEIPTKKLEHLRDMVLQHVGLRGRVLSEFYLSTQEIDESQLAMMMGFEVDDTDPGILRYSLAAFDLTKQHVLDQKSQEVLEHEHGDGNNITEQKSSLSMTNSPETTRESAGVPNPPDEEADILAEAAILEEMYNPCIQSNVDLNVEDARSEATLSQYRKNLEQCTHALMMLQGDLDERAHLQQVIHDVAEELRMLQPQLQLLQANTEEAARIAPRDIASKVVQRLRANEDFLKSKLEKWNMDRFDERIKFHESLMKELEDNTREVEKEMGEIQQAHLSEKGNFRASAAPREVQETLQQLSADREVYRERHHNHSKHRTHARQQYQVFQNTNRCVTENPTLEDARLTARIQREADEDVALIASSFEFPDPSGALPGMVTRLHENLVDRLVALRQVMLDISAHAEALLVKARQNLVTCLTLSLHRPPVQLQVFIRDLVCEGLEQFMREHKAKAAQEQEAKLLQLLEEECNLQKAKEDKEKKKKTKSKAKKVKRKEIAKPEPVDGEEAATHQAAAVEEVSEIGAENPVVLANNDDRVHPQEAPDPEESHVDAQDTVSLHFEQEELVISETSAEVQDEEWTASTTRRYKHRSDAKAFSTSEHSLPGKQGSRPQANHRQMYGRDMSRTGKQVDEGVAKRDKPSTIVKPVVTPIPVAWDAGATDVGPKPAQGKHVDSMGTDGERAKEPVPGQTYETENKRRSRRRRGKKAGEIHQYHQQPQHQEQAVIPQADVHQEPPVLRSPILLAEDTVPPTIQPHAGPEAPSVPTEELPHPTPSTPADLPTYAPVPATVPTVHSQHQPPLQQLPHPQHQPPPMMPRPMMMQHMYSHGYPQGMVPVVTPMPVVPGMPHPMITAGYPYAAMHYPHGYFHHIPPGIPMQSLPHMGVPYHHPGMMGIPHAYTPPPPPAPLAPESAVLPESDVASYMQQMLTSAKQSMPKSDISSESPQRNCEVVEAPETPSQEAEAAGSGDSQLSKPTLSPEQISVSEQEEADMEAAIAASLQDVQSFPYRDHSQGSAGELASFDAEGLPQLALGLGQDTEPMTAGVGLMNGIGQYNCFLNVIVQCLWHLTNFRKGMLECDPLVHDSNPVIKALFHLFQSFHELDMQSKRELSGVPLSPKADSSVKRVVSPTELREALSAVEGPQIFRLGEMNDAAEVLGVLWGCMHDAHEQAHRKRERSAKPWRSLALVDEMFGLEVNEVMACAQCQKETRKANYVQHRQTVPAMALRQHSAAEPGASMGRLIRAVTQSHRLPCDPDEGGCGAANPMCLNLRRPPGVLTLELVWATERTPAEEIKATLALVDDVVDLGETFSGLREGEHMYRLRSMVCYYGAHYQAFVLSPVLGKWLIFDDESIGLIGSWDAVKAKCLAGRIQPSVLFFERDSS